MRLHRSRLRTVCALATLAFTLPFSSPLLAQETVLELDPAQTHIQFTLDATLHTVHGTFKLKHGTVRFDPRTGKAGGQVVVDVTSGDTGNGGRDHKMHKEILQSAEYPEATFVPAQIQGSVNAQGDSQVEVQGAFNLHGSGHPITLTFHAQGSANQLAARTRFVIPYQQW